MENKNTQINKWFLYVRKSTDEEDRQVMSIDAQIFELKEFAEKEGLEISEKFIEKQSAKIPGRPVFNSMLAKIGQTNEPVGILAWHPDRLSRNSIDGGNLIYLLDTGKLAGLKFPTFAFENNPSGKFFLAIGLSNAKYYIDNLAENVKRGMREKLRRGEWGGSRPAGYIYDHRLRNIVPDPKQAKVVQKVFREFATGKYTLRSISKYAFDNGLKSKRATPFSNSKICNLLTNELYLGLMHWKGEVYEGKYQPLIAKQLFAKVQEVLQNRSRPRKTKQHHNFPFCGLFNCKCGSMFTAQFAKGNGGIYRYYRCSRKKGNCKEPYIQEKELSQKSMQKLQTIALPIDWANEIFRKLNEEKEEQAQSINAFVQDANKKLFLIQEKLDKLLEGYLDGIIDEETYKRKKEELIKQKIVLKDEKTTLERKRMSGWVEPTRDFIKTCVSANYLDKEKSLSEISQFVQKIGTNRIISNKIPHWDFVQPYQNLADFLARPRLSGGAQNKCDAREARHNSQCSIVSAHQESNLEPTA